MDSWPAVCARAAEMQQRIERIITHRKTPPLRVTSPSILVQTSEATLGSRCELPGNKNISALRITRRAEICRRRFPRFTRPESVAFLGVDPHSVERFPHEEY